ncbi:MAG: PqqD family protein [Fibrobacter sp.]|nr:PqqD family protein [Bacteroidaceae bacterium]MBR2074871.1 PqqD family protein [Fibrobacter sp.]MBR6621654.1 PqqD family protein [Bacteroides sp.]
MKLNKDLVLREVGGEYMIVNPFSDTVDMTQVYSLNETAAWLWQQMEGKEFTVADLVAVLCEEYEVDTETATADLTELCQQWIAAGLAQE